MRSPKAKLEGRLALGYSLVACLGFATDALVLTLGLRVGLPPAWARMISLVAAMQLTFLVNGWLVFHCLSRRTWAGAWLGYMTTNGFGNFCNYWVFVTLVSLHHPLWSNRWLDLAIGGVTAWLINYASARYLIFGAHGDGCTPLSEVIARVRRRLATPIPPAGPAIPPPSRP